MLTLLIISSFLSRAPIVLKTIDAISVNHWSKHRELLVRARRGSRSIATDDESCLKVHTPPDAGGLCCLIALLAINSSKLRPRSPKAISFTRITRPKIFDLNLQYRSTDDPRYSSLLNRPPNSSPSSPPATYAEILQGLSTGL